MNAFDNLFNGNYNNYLSNNTQTFATFETLPRAQATENQPAPQNPEAKLATGGERLFRVRLIDPKNNQNGVNIDLYAKIFAKPLKALTGKPTSEYRVRGFTWVAPGIEVKGRSKQSFDDALNKLRDKIFI
jgi:hypothetical protein